MNRSFYNCLKPLVQREATCKVIDVKLIFYSQANQTHFNQKGFVDST